jgi:adenosyl cobinamide kinase/adenosyl cobinamide phosphate guanylyltransferase
VLGGARSGKSRYAESLIMAMPRPWAYVATATAHDREMAERIAAHRTRRAGHWQTIEAPHDLAAAIAGLPRGAAVLIDCMTMWLANRVLAADGSYDVQAERDAGYDTRFDAGFARDLDARIAAEIDALVTALGRHAGAAVIVSNEVGFAIVPDNALARRFRDLQGSINQQLAASADRTVLTVAGLPLVLKPVESPQGAGRIGET